jgi:hypothetical protein
MRTRVAALPLVSLIVVLSACGGPGSADSGADASDARRDTAGDLGSDAPRACGVDTDCDDHTFCNGVERCMPGASGADARGCVAAIAPACQPMQVCNESTSTCQSMCEASGDADMDGHRAAACGGDDCDDADANRFPGNVEVCDTTAHDEDCDATTFGTRDLDGDSYVDALCCNVGSSGTRQCGDDCNDARRDVHPTATEACDGFDNNCNDTIDEGVTVAGFRDADHDGYGDDAVPMMLCPGSPNFATAGGDCDDTTPARHPGLSEACDGVDNDCNGMVDDHTTVVNWYADSDGDGFGDPRTVVRSCAPPSTGVYVLVAFDCDDAHATVNPGAAEICDGLDDDCNGRADFVIAGTDGEDDDLDRHADARCGGDDCNDLDSTTYGGATELCDARDNNCNSMIDEGTSIVAWYVDADADGDGSATGAPVMSCPPVAGRVRSHGDCDDSNPALHAGATELCDGVDQNCDGSVTGEDIDMDGQLGLGSTCAGGPRGSEPATDCDDTNAMIHAGAVEHCDGVDEDCSGTADAMDPAASAACTADPNVASAMCSSSTCAYTCAAGYADCSPSAPGCETHTAADETNCGACGANCATGQICVNGACRATTTSKYVFFTGRGLNGNLGGLAAADARCQTAANESGLPGTYRAYVSTRAMTLSTRFTHSTTPYILVTGTTVASNWTDLVDGTLAHAIDRDETGTPADGYAWTATNSMGIADPAPQTSCVSFTSAAHSEVACVGRTTATSADWACVYYQFCDVTAHGLYCFQQ